MNKTTALEGAVEVFDDVENKNRPDIETEETEIEKADEGNGIDKFSVIEEQIKTELNSDTMGPVVETIFATAVIDKTFENQLSNDKLYTLQNIIWPEIFFL